MNYSSTQDDGAFSFRNLERFESLIILLCIKVNNFIFTKYDIMILYMYFLI